MHRGTHAVIAAVLVVACAGCEPGDSALPGACQVDTAGIEVVDGAVTDTLTVTCDPRPVRHEIKGWLEHRRDSEQAWAQLNASGWVTTVPDAEGFRVQLSSRPCVAGEWLTVWRVRGVGPDPSPAPI